VVTALAVNFIRASAVQFGDETWQALDLLVREDVSRIGRLAEQSTQVQKPIPNCQQPIPKRQRYPECNANSGCNVKMLGHGCPPAIASPAPSGDHYAILYETSDNVLRLHAAHSGVLKSGRRYRLRLVYRFRSSPHLAALSHANFGIESTLATSNC